MAGKKAQSTVSTVIAMVVIVAVIVVGFIALQRKMETGTTAKVSDDVDKLLNMDFDNDYPGSPKEVMKYYTRFLKAYYNESLSDEEIEKLAAQNQKIYDDEVIKLNPLDTYVDNLKKEILTYKKEKQTLANYEIQDSTDAKYEDKGGYHLCTISVYYYIQAQNTKNNQRTFEDFHLRQDDEGHWKILAWETTEKDFRDQ